MTESLQKKTFWGMIWGGIESFSTRLISFFVGIILARLLTPDDYGLVGMLAIFIAISQTLIESGMGNALVRKADRTNKDFSTVFYFNVAISLLLYIILYFSAPWIAAFFHKPELISLTRVLTLPLIINSLGMVQQTILTIELDFKRQSVITIVSSILASVIGLIAAFSGCGAWSLVFSILSASVCRSLLLWVWGNWRPGWIFSWISFRELFAFSSKLVTSALLDTTYNNIRPLIIGKLYSGAELGYYTRAEGYAAFPATTTTGLLSRVTYPVLCTMQDDNVRLAHNYRRLIRLSAFVVFPLLMGLASLAHPMVSALITDKWLPCVPMLQLLCCAYIWWPIHALNLNLLQVKGRSDLFLKLEIIKKTSGVLMLIVTVPISVTAICVGTVITSLIALIINTYYTEKLIGIGFKAQMNDLLPLLLLSASMGAVVWFGVSLLHSPIYKILTGIPLGILYYLTLAKFFRSEELDYIANLLKKQLFRKNAT